jgi:hypothetical protein
MKISPMSQPTPMRIRAVIILLLVLVADVFAQAERARLDRDKLAAATAAAVAGLKDAIARETVAPGVTVGALLDRTKGHGRLLDALRRAEQPGGPRWVDDKTCQVRLEISGKRVADALVGIAASQPKKTPIAADVLAVKLTAWNVRTFSATGSSTGATEIDNIRPGGEAAAWANVTDEHRRAAVAAAKDNAVNAAIDSIRDVKLPDGKTAGDALKDPAVRERLVTWLAARPVTQVEFRDDLNVAVQLAAPAAEFYDAFRDAMRAAEVDAVAWDAVRGEFAQRLAAPTGVAPVPGKAAAVASPAPLQLPALPPVWTNQQIEAEGYATAGGSKLKCARLAEARAATDLLGQIEKLPLTNAMTIGQASEQDAQVREAASRAASRGRTYKVEYDSDGGARVWVQLDLHSVWQELRGAR